jgi:HD-GYP domain-containing protein (c-di-GMP phosphodiesterase class II)
VELDLNAKAYDSLSSQLTVIHDRICEVAPDIVRISCALYDPDDDMLKTFINSTHAGVALRAYQFRLRDSESLSAIARSGSPRLLTQLQDNLRPTNRHSRYVLEEGFESSYTVPLSHQGTFLGFLFFDSRANDTFTEPIQRELSLSGQLVAISIVNELLAIRSIISTVMLASDFTNFRDAETGAHLQRMSRFARMIASRLAMISDLSDEFVEQVFLYAPLHDIGKVAIPDSILLKPGKLTPDEWEVMKTHTTRGAEMVDTIIRDLGMQALPNQQLLRNIVELHHEAIDGQGYPHGLAGDEIPLEARIVAVADVYDALTCHRPYKRPWTPREAIEELRVMVGAGKLDAECVAVFAAAHDETERIRARYPEDAPLDG